MTSFPLLSLIVWAPFVAALSLLAIQSRSGNAVRLVAVAGAGVSLIGTVVVALSYDYAAGGVQFREHMDVVPSLGIAYALGVDGWGVSLLLLTGIIIFAGSWATWTLKDRHKEYYVLLLGLVTGVFGVFASLDLFVFFLFYEL